MEKVIVDPVDRWGWECPECQTWQEEDEDPSYQETIFCENCGKEFEPEVSG